MAKGADSPKVRPTGKPPSPGGKARAGSPGRKAGKKKASKKKAAATTTEPPNGFKPGVFAGESAVTSSELVLQAAYEVDSVTVGEVPADTTVYVLETREMPGGVQRAMVTLGDPSRGHLGGWVTSVSHNGTEFLCAGQSFVRTGTTDELADMVDGVELVEDDGYSDEEDEEDEEGAETPTPAVDTLSVP